MPDRSAALAAAAEAPLRQICRLGVGPQNPFDTWFNTPGVGSRHGLRDRPLAQCT